MAPRDRGGRGEARPRPGFSEPISQPTFNAAELSKKVLETVTHTADKINVTNARTVEELAKDFTSVIKDIKRPGLEVVGGANSALKHVNDNNNILKQLKETNRNLENNTPRRTYEILSDIYNQEVKQATFLKNIEKNTKLSLGGTDGSGSVVETPVGHLEEIEDNTSFLGKLYKTMAIFAGGMLKSMGLQNSRLYRQLRLDNEWYKMDQERWEWEQRDREIEKVSFLQRAKDTIKKPFQTDTMDNGVVKMAMDGTAKVAGFYGAIGGATSKLMQGLLTRFGWMASTGGIVGMLKSVGFALAGIGSIFTAIAALLTGAAIVSIMKDPTYLTRYTEAFMTIWKENIIPVWEYMKYLGDQFMQWWNSGGEDGTAAIGNFINETMIYLLGNVIPNALTIVGTSIKNGIETIRNLVMIPADIIGTLVDGLLDIGARIMGLFGIGKYGEQSFLDNILAIFAAPGEIIGKIFFDLAVRMDNIIAAVSDMWGTIVESLREMLGIDWLDAKLTEIWTGVSEYISSTITGMWTGFSEWIGESIAGIESWLREFDFMDMMLNKISSMFETIASYMPSTDSIKTWLRGKLGRLADWVPGLGLDPVEAGEPAPSHLVPNSDVRPPSDEEESKGWLSGITDSVNGLVGGVVDSFHNAVNNAATILQNSDQEAMKEGFKQVFPSWLKEWVPSFGDKEDADLTSMKLDQGTTRELYKSLADLGEIMKPSSNQAPTVIIDNSNNSTSTNNTAVSGGGRVHMGVPNTSPVSPMRERGRNTLINAI